MTKRTKDHLSIGEVVEMLAREFPDVSVSKVRFLEAEGLIEPERTASGYRKFFPADIARLRYILRLQRDQFVPLKVIRQRLDHFDPSDMVEEGSSVLPPPGPLDSDEDLGLTTGLSLSFDELAASSGLERSFLRELEEYGLIDAHTAEGNLYYDEDDLLVAKIAKDFSKYGIEPRHMKMYRLFADREAGLFEQVLLPLRSGASDGRRSVTQSMHELAKLSKRLRSILLRTGLREHISG